VAAQVGACNGHPELCGRRLDEVAFAAAHNAMSNASISDWMFPHHQAGLPDMLVDGIRALMLDVHYGFPGGERIKTDLEGEQVTRDKLVGHWARRASTPPNASGTVSSAWTRADADSTSATGLRTGRL